MRKKKEIPQLIKIHPWQAVLMSITEIIIKGIDASKYIGIMYFSYKTLDSITKNLAGKTTLTNIELNLNILISMCVTISFGTAWYYKNLYLKENEKLKELLKEKGDGLC